MTHFAIQEDLSSAGMFSQALPISSRYSLLYLPLCPDTFIFKTILFYLQVFGEGTDAVKKSLEGIFDDTVPDGKVKIHACSFWSLSRASA